MHFRVLTRRALLGATASGLLPNAHAARISAEGQAVTAALGVVATEPPDTARAGARLLAMGGNAMDAAAAACVAACMLQPNSVDIGGYVCAAVVREGKTGKIWSLDANSVAPAAATERMFTVLPPEPGRSTLNENEYFCTVKDNANVDGPLAVGVPGVMAGIGTLWERWGRAKWPAILEPALALLEKGFPYGGVAEAIKAREHAIRLQEPTVRHLMPAGKLPAPTDIWHRRDMEKTLQRLSKEGWRDFYQGELAHRIVEYVRRGGGILSRQDMAQFQPRVTATYSTSYRNARVHSAILANGGLTVLQVLNMLECFDAATKDDPMHYHRMIEILKLAWRDRLRYLGDPDHARVPVERLLSKDFAAGRVETLRTVPDFIDRLPAPSARQSPGTVHISSADAEGNMVAVTISHGGGFGSCVTIPDTGITLGHGMCRFDPRPGKPNSIGPGKRPLNNTCPSLIELPDRRVALGLRGGRRIVSVVAHMCQGVVDWKYTAAEAPVGPRVHVEEQEPAETGKGVSDAIVGQLRAMGHTIRHGQVVGGESSAVECLANGTVRGGGTQWSVGVS